MKKPLTYEIVFPKNYTKPPLPGRNQWLKALRSGEFKQGRGQLCYRNQYCCLGVLSKIQNRLILDKGIERDNGNNHEYLSHDNPIEFGTNGDFPQDVCVKITNCCSNYGIISQGELGQCNDNGLNFEQIADIIEKIWKHAKKNW